MAADAVRAALFGRMDPGAPGTVFTDRPSPFERFGSIEGSKARPP
jgi:hypothetical protein